MKIEIDIKLIDIKLIDIKLIGIKLIDIKLIDIKLIDINESVDKPIPKSWNDRLTHPKNLVD